MVLCGGLGLTVPGTLQPLRFFDKKEMAYEKNFSLNVRCCTMLYSRFGARLP